MNSAFEQLFMKPDYSWVRDLIYGPGEGGQSLSARNVSMNEMLPTMKEELKRVHEAIRERIIISKEEAERIQLQAKITTTEVIMPEQQKNDVLSILGEGQYPLIKSLIGFKEDMEKKLQLYPFEKNVFLMMKYRDSNNDLSDFMIESLREHGLTGVRADQPQWNITKNVYNPLAVLYCCKYGIALFDEPEESQNYSPNVAYELGIMHYQNKDCLILKHASLTDVFFDLVKELYKTYDKDLKVKAFIKSWITQIAS